MITTLIVVFASLFALFLLLFILKSKSAKKDSQEGQTFHRIFELANDAILMVDLVDGRVLDCNKAAGDLLGYTQAEIREKSLQDLHPESAMSRSAEVIAEVWQKKGLVYQDVPFVTKDGQKIPVEISAKVIDFRSKPGVLLFARDIRVRLEAEQKIKDYTVDLEKTNIELRETQSRLVQSEKLASVGNLAAGVAHEMNTPVGVISSNANVSNRAIEKIADELNKNSISIEKIPGLTRAMKSITGLASSSLQAAQRISLIVNSLKSFSRVDESEVKEVDLHEGLDNALVLLEGEMRGKVSVEKKYGDLPLVNCHPGQINQVYMNILQNAVQAISDEGTITLRTTLENGNVIINFADTGKGISRDDLESIFDPGFTTKGSRIGAGFGLPISYNIVENHGGSLGLESEPGVGTTVTIKLPISEKPL